MKYISCPCVLVKKSEVHRIPNEFKPIRQLEQQLEQHENPNWLLAVLYHFPSFPGFTGDSYFHHLPSIPPPGGIAAVCGSAISPRLMRKAVAADGDPRPKMLGFHGKCRMNHEYP
jgi:hypothetical protein